MPVVMAQERSATVQSTKNVIWFATSAASARATQMAVTRTE